MKEFLFSIKYREESRMKKLLLFSVIAMIGITASAASMTKEEYVSKRKASAEKAGKAFDEKALAAKFDKQDANKDGVLTDEEQAAAKAASAAKKAKKAE